MFRFAIILIIGLASAGCAERAADGSAASAVKPSADLIVTNARIYTMDSHRPWAEAVAVAGGKIVAVGADADVRSYQGEATEVVDVGGGFMLPGLIDAHLHPVGGALEALFSCKFAFSATPAEIAATLRGCAERNPSEKWISGGRWTSSFFDKNAIESPRAFLDAVSGDKAVRLTDDSGHNVWVNSEALRLLGINAGTPDPEGGTIVRDAEGEPNGLLLETAAKLSVTSGEDYEYSRTQYVAAVKHAVAVMNAYGITGMKDAGAYPGTVPAYHEVDSEGGLTVHTEVSLRTFYGRRDQPLDSATLDELVAQRDRYRGENMHPDTVKIFLDGVPTVARTAAMLGPYLPDDDHGADFDGGPVHVDESVLAQDLIALDARGFTVKMHAAGDRSVRVALDAVEAMRRTNGDSGHFPEIAHAGFIDPVDLPRFSALHVAADIAPAIWGPSPIIQSIFDALGERGHRYWPNRDLIDSGALVIAGSDWPSAVASANPWYGIEALVTRADPDGLTPGTLWPEQAVTLDEALRFHTLNAAVALRMQDSIGAIEVSKYADMVLLDRNLFEIEAGEIGNTRALRTWFGGRTVYQGAAVAQ